MRMKRILCVLLCLAALGSLCACGGREGNVRFENKEDMQQALCGDWLMVVELEPLPEPELAPNAEEYLENGEILKAAKELFIDSSVWGYLGEYIAWSVSESELAVVRVSEDWLSRYYYDTVADYELDKADGELSYGGRQPIDGWKWRQGVISVPGRTLDVQLDEKGNYCLVNRMNGELYAVKMEAAE